MIEIITRFDGIVGRTIKSVRRMKLIGFDDTGFLRIEFTDGTHCTIEGGYGGYTGDSEDEYKTLIGMAGNERESKLEEVK